MEIGHCRAFRAVSLADSSESDGLAEYDGSEPAQVQYANKVKEVVRKAQ